MSALQVTAVLIRLFAIWCGIDAASWLLSVWDPTYADEYSTGYTLAFTALYTSVAIALWVFPTVIARKMLLPNVPESSNVADAKTLLSVAVVAVGLLMLAQGLPNALSALVVLLEASNWDMSLRSERQFLTLRTASAFIQPLCGLFLVVRSAAITKLLWPRVERGARDA